MSTIADGANISPRCDQIMSKIVKTIDARINANCQIICGSRNNGLRLQTPMNSRRIASRHDAIAEVEKQFGTTKIYIILRKIDY